MLYELLQGNSRGLKSRVKKFISHEIFGDTQKVENIVNWKNASCTYCGKNIAVGYYIQFDDLGCIRITIEEEIGTDKMVVKYKDIHKGDYVSKEELLKRHKEIYNTSDRTLKEIEKWY